MTPISSHLDRKILVNKELLYDQKENFAFFAGPTREIPREQDGSILPLRVANRNTGLALCSVVKV